MVSSVLSLPVHVANVWWEDEVKHEGEEVESRERIVSLLPLLCLVCIGDPNDNTVSNPGVAPAAHFR
jgi:hypothetical protein